MNKTTIYLDIEDDITSIIDKVKQADATIVALVPPKRMPVLQSSVNLKLLRKISTASKKRLVLITSEKSLLPLAGSVGIYVADTLKSRPYVPEAPDTTGDNALVIEDDLEIQQPKSNDKAQTKSEAPLPEDSKKTKLSGALPKIKGKIPNFNKFRLRIILMVGGVILLVVLWFFAFKVLPKAEVVVNAQTSRLPVEFDFKIDNDAETDDIEKRTLATVTETFNRVLTQTVDATGEENVGKKATGTIKITNDCYETEDATSIPAGTVLIASGNRRFTTNLAVSVPAAESGVSEGSPYCNETDVDVSITAENRGSQYNLPSGTFYSVSGFGSSMYGSGSTSGGTNEFVKAVSQKDIDDTVDSLETEEHDEFIAQLSSEFSVEVVPIVESFGVIKRSPTSDPAVGARADRVEVKLTYTYTMRGVSKEALEQLLNQVIDEELGESLLEVYDNGINSMRFTVDGQGITASTTSRVGPSLDTLELANQIARMKFSEAKNLIESKPGVLSTEIRLSPFWVFSLPKADRIIIDVVIAGVDDNDE